MGMLGWIAIALVALGCLICIRRDRRERKRQRDMVMYMRQSDLYAHLYPMLRKLESMHVESVAIRREEVRIRTYRPAGRVLRFTFEKHGFDPLTDEALYALMQAIGVDVPNLRDRKRYELITHADERASGGKAAWYEYLILTDYKDDMSRANYLYGSNTMKR